MSEIKYTSTQRKGHIPLKSDVLLFIIFKAIIGALFLYILLYSILPSVRADPNYNYFAEIFTIIPLIIVSDVMGNVMSNYITNRLVRKWDYDVRDTHKEFEMRRKKYIQYTIYLIFRVSWFIFGLFWIVYNMFVESGVIFAFSFLLTCLTMNILTKIVAWVSTHLIFS